MQRCVMVTGGAGYIGSHACKALAAAGWTPVAFDNLSCGHRWAVRWGPLVHGNLADTALLQQTLRRYQVRAVLHFAANAYVGESMRDPGKYFRNNAAGTFSLLEAMVSAGVPHLVLSSTCATYGQPERLPLDEDHPQAPLNPYGESKLFIERSLKWYEQAHGLQSMVLRYFNAAGADADGEIGEDHEPETHLIPLVMQAALGVGPPVQVFGTDYPTRDGTAGAKRIRTISEDRRGRLWIGADDGLWRVTDSYLVRVAGARLLDDVPITAVLLDSRERLWLATRDRGACRLSPELEALECLDVRGYPAYWVDLSRPGAPPRYVAKTSGSQKGG